MLLTAAPASAQQSASAQPIFVAQAALPAAAGGVTSHAGLTATARRTHFVIGLEKPTRPHVYTLANPNRVIVDLPDVKIQLPTHTGDRPTGLVASFRGGLAEPGKMRVVIDVTAPVLVESAKTVPAADGRSYNLVVEIAPVDTPKKAALTTSPAGAGVAGLQPPTPRPAAPPSRQAAKSYKPLIVLDPGHGGQDSGAIKWGTVEKDVVLAFSKVLKTKLEATGKYRVLMTRDGDTFVDLDKRREFAEQHKAALFIAVHADYAGGSARGATIYSLREGVANDLKRSAKGEVAQTVMTPAQFAEHRQKVGHVETNPNDVKNMLADLAQREVNITKERTSVFTRSVVDFMGTSTNMQNNPDRTAAFRVLKTAQVPSVLIELAYVTNQQDAKNLKSEEWRDKVSGSIMTAIENYFSNQIARLPM